jgi:hypothetical protein
MDLFEDCEEFAGVEERLPHGGGVNLVALNATTECRHSRSVSQHLPSLSSTLSIV